MSKWQLAQDRLFDPDPVQRRLARELYEGVVGLPIVCPHGHVDPRWLAEDTFDAPGAPVTPSELFIIPDHYVFRMLYSQGVPMDSLGIPRADGTRSKAEHRRIWQTFAENFHLFRGTPSGMWLAHELNVVFGIQEKPNAQNAQTVYDEIADKLVRPEYRPRALFERFNIEVLCTTDAASDSLQYHQAIKDSGWQGVVRPTFRPDAVVNLLAPGWKKAVEALGTAAGCEITTYAALIRALEARRAFFKQMGCKATDHGAESPYTARLTAPEAEAIFARALAGQSTAEDARRFTGHMLMEMARMSTEDGMTMQLHVGVYRNHNAQLFDKFGADKGADIPIKTEFVHNLRPLLTEYGNDPRLTLILFGMDESVYSSELAPLAGHYPTLRLGPPWWFQDSPNGMTRYFDQVMETAGLYNTVGFNDDTRAFVSIPARHDVWRRASANWLAGMVLRGLLDEGEAAEMAPDMANGLARRAYKL